MSELTAAEQVVAKFRGESPAPPAPEPDPVEPDTAEPEQTEEPDLEPAAEADPPLLAGKYKDVAALEQAYAEAQTLIGRQGNELSEARALRDEFQSLKEQIQQPTQPTYDPGSIDEWLAQNPQNVPALAQQAIDTGDNYLYQRALDAWGELDRVGAMDFHARAVADARIAELRKELEPALAQVKQVATTNAFTDAFNAVKARVPDDFSQVLDAVTPETATAMKAVVDMLANGDAASKEAALETLYWSEKGRQAGTLNQAAAQVAAQTAQQAVAARTDAQVASASGSQDRQPVTGIDLWREQFVSSDAFKKYST